MNGDFEKSHERAKKQFENMHEDAKRVEKKVLGPVAERVQLEIANGGTDFSLYNLVLSTTSFKDCATSRDSNQRVYEAVYPYIRKAIQRNKSMLHTLKKYDLSPEDRAYVEELEKSQDFDPFKMSADLLEQLKEAAKNRSKAGIKFYNKGII